MKHKLFYLTISFVITLTFISCISVKKIEYKDLEIVKIEKINLTETQMQVALSCYNPNKYSLTLKNTILDVYLNGEQIASSKQNQSVLIPKKSTFKSQLQVNINIKKTLLNLGMGILNQEFELKTKGFANVKKGMISKKMPVEITKKLKLDFLF